MFSSQSMNFSVSFTTRAIVSLDLNVAFNIIMIYAWKRSVETGNVRPDTQNIVKMEMSADFTRKKFVRIGMRTKKVWKSLEQKIS